MTDQTGMWPAMVMNIDTYQQIIIVFQQKVKGFMPFYTGLKA